MAVGCELERRKSVTLRHSIRAAAAKTWMAECRLALPAGMDMISLASEQLSERCHKKKRVG